APPPIVAEPRWGPPPKSGAFGAPPYGSDPIAGRRGPVDQRHRYAMLGSGSRAAAEARDRLTRSEYPLCIAREAGGCSGRALDTPIVGQGAARAVGARRLEHPPGCSGRALAIPI